MGTCGAPLAEVLPVFVKAVAPLGDVPPELKPALEAKGAGVYSDPAAPGAPALMDALLLFPGEATPDELAPAIRRDRLRVHRNGAIFAVARAEHWPPEEVSAAFNALGLGLYRVWMFASDAFVRLEGLEYPVTGIVLFQFQRTSYDPVAHARAFLRKMDFFVALSILLDTPDHWFRSEEERGMYYAERMVCYLAQDRHVGKRLRLEHLVSVQRLNNRRRGCPQSSPRSGSIGTWSPSTTFRRSTW